MLYIIITFLLLIILYVSNPWKYPLITESDLSHFKFPWMQLYYANKYLRPVKRPARGSGLEKYFKENKKPQNRITLNNCSELNINAAGDLMVRGEFDRGDSSTIWENLGADLFSSDITFGNMEYAVNENMLIDKTIRYSMSHKQADIMLGDSRFGDFDIVSLANNHINDSFTEGIISTRKYLDEKNILHFGANSCPEDVDNIQYITKKGIKTAFIGYTFTTNGIALEENFKFGTNLIRFNAINDNDYDPSLIYSHIKKAKDEGADIIIASLHWGVEFEYYPSVRLVERGHELLEAGVDVIIGHHPHILNPSEWYKTKDGRDALCFYSLGSITTTAMPWIHQNTSQIAGIVLEKGTSEDGETITRIKEASLTPTFFVRKGRGRTSRHRIFPLFKIVKLIKEGKKPVYINFIQSIRLSKAEKEYKKHFKQESFQYK